ncbi:FAD-dependent oxidoreductase [Corynebacterium sp. CNJ-954]|uniref:NAD(P)/FAD-dependent oxidoreductase n=1 Tax=Corynebacterium sp. CNJ-954 TaxID=1904962 RepID=UPI0009624EFF|nr:FAD-dependent oxidoreductase [Corynebacterium sp. CNJ-954]OLT55279.1 FAD-dependent oxidoreductase [Corynebacterium sp. CNJ-954]
MESYDVAVIGGGIVGAAVAAELAGRGKKTVLVERHRVASGTSAHCEGNLLVSDKGPGPELDLARLGNQQWRQFHQQVNEELGPDFPSVEFEPKGGLVVATSDVGADKLREFSETQRSAGVTAENLTDAQVRNLEPWLTDRFTAAIWYPGDCQVQPTIASEALVALARKRGAVVRENSEVFSALRTNGTVTGIQTTSGDIHAEHTVIACGPWSGAVAAMLGASIPVKPRRGIVMVTAKMPQRVFHKVYDADYVGAVGSGSEGLMTSSVIESTQGGTVLIGSSREQVGFDDRFRAEVLRSVASKATKLFPFLANTAVTRSYSGFRPFLPDHLPIIGPDNHVPGLWYATGHEGAGIGLSLPTASLLADIMDDAPTELDPAAFSISRPSLKPHLEAHPTRNERTSA